MQRWLQIGLITFATILPISIIIYLTKRFSTQSEDKNQVTHASTRPSSRNTNHASQVIHNYSPSMIEFPIDQTKIGYIIGRGGETIKRIQTESDTRIRFREQTGMPHSSESNANNYDRIVVISGRPECTQLAKSMIEKMLQEKARDEQPMQVCLKIPDWICGLVIGHRGQNIKHLQATSGARITVENLPNNTVSKELRNCIVSGSPDQIRIASELIEAMLERETIARTRSAYRSYHGKPRSISTSGYLSSPTKDSGSQESRHHYITNTDLRTGAIPLQKSPVKSPNLISMEERVYLMYFSQQVQSHLQPLPLNQEFFTAYVSTIDRNALIWIQLLDDIGMELQDLIDNMSSYYTDVVENNGGEITDSVFRTNNLPPFDTESVEMTESTAVEERRKFSKPASSPECDEREQIQVHSQDPNLDSANSSDSNRQSPFDNQTNDIASTPNKSRDSSSPYQPGMVVAAPFTEDDKYYRAVIDRIEPGENQAYVYFLDFGDYDVCKLSMLHFLKEDFKILPYQAVLCQLNDIEVGPDGLSEYAFTRLQELASCAQWKRICVLPSKTEQSFHRNRPYIRNCPTVKLIDTNGVRDINVSQSLIQEQLVTRAEYQHTFS